MTATDTIPADGGPASPAPPLETSTPSRARSWLSTHWPELLVVLGVLTLFAWAIDRNGYGNTYYAAAIRSMTRSWHNFFYGSLDPGGWITVDKPPFAFWLQALSARVFGFNSWALLLPGAACGALAVWVLMATVRRPWGRTAGVVAGRRPCAHAGHRGGQPEQQPRRHARADRGHRGVGHPTWRSLTAARAGWRWPDSSVASASSRSFLPRAW